MRTVTVENNKIVVEVDGAKVSYPLKIVRKRITSLLQDLEEWREYERLLTPRAVDVATGPDVDDFCEHDVIRGECLICPPRY